MIRPQTILNDGYTIIKEFANGGQIKIHVEVDKNVQIGLSNEIYSTD